MSLAVCCIGEQTPNAIFAPRNKRPGFFISPGQASAATAASITQTTTFFTIPRLLCSNPLDFLVHVAGPDFPHVAGECDNSDRIASILDVVVAVVAR
jgi:hypothetical protein